MSNQNLIVCGWDELFILDLSKDPQQKIWTWRAQDQADMPESFRTQFQTIDDCKPFENGNKILITSSGGGVALLDRKQGAVLFYAHASNAHSADLLPYDRVAVAASVSDAGGNRLIIFDIGVSDRELLSFDLPAGHGVVWDAQRHCLWALSSTDIRVYDLKDWESSQANLVLREIYATPSEGGHELFALNDSPYLALSTETQCYYFNRDSCEFSSHPQLADRAHINCLSLHNDTQQLAYTQKEDGNWWSENIYFEHPDKTLHFPGEHLYKVRWQHSE
ncbi:MAG: hypothetical protein HRU15_18740 [Planctomycetes bacterium]|nr:hypothetical protein [Planctomycetota bacterium]